MRRFLLLGIASIFFSSTSPAELDSVNEEIKHLKLELHTLRLKAMQEEIRGQGYMLEQWGKFSDSTENSEKSVHNAERLEKKLHELETERDRLLQHQTSSHE